LRDSALAASEQILQTAASEEESLRNILKNTGNSYAWKHWDAPGWLNGLSSLSAVIFILTIPGSPAIATWLLVHDLTGSNLWAGVGAALAGILMIGSLFFFSNADLFIDYVGWPLILLISLSSGYVVFVVTGRAQFSWVAGAAAAIA
jgi:hypothetical protein